MNGSIKSYLNEHALVIKDLNLSVIDLAKLIDLTKNKIISNTVANNKVLPLMINSNKTAFEIANENNWVQESDTDLLEDYINQVIDKYPEEVVKYKNGKKGLLGLFIGKVMKLSKGKADPKLTSQLITKKLTK